MWIGQDTGVFISMLKYGPYSFNRLNNLHFDIETSAFLFIKIIVYLKFYIYVRFSKHQEQYPYSNVGEIKKEKKEFYIVRKCCSVVKNRQAKKQHVCTYVRKIVLLY